MILQVLSKSSSRGRNTIRQASVYRKYACFGENVNYVSLK